MEGPMKEKARCPWNLLRLFGIRKMRVSAVERRVRDREEVGQIRRSSASDHVVANCSNLVFYSAFYRQTVQIHKTVIVYPFLTVVFRRYRYIGGRGGIPRTQKKKSFSIQGLPSKAWHCA